MNIYRLRIYMLVEGEYESEWFEFYLTKDDMKKGRDTIESEHKRPDGSWIPNIDYMEFTEEEVPFSETKHDMTVAKFETLFGKQVTIKEVEGK